MNTPYTQKSRAARHFKDKLFQTVCVGAAGMAILVLVILLGSILFGGIGRFDPQFLRSLNSPTDAEKAGIFPALIGSIWLLVICALTAIPLGVGTAVLLEEYQPANKVLSKLHGFVQTNITNLAGVPSIVYGILGYFAFATMFGLFGSMQEPNVTIGQTWYHEYLGQDGKNYYVRVSGRDAEQRPPSADMVFYADARPGAARVPDVRIGEGLTKLKAELDAMSEQLKDLVEATRADSRSPAQIDQATAGQIADQVMAAADLEADPAVLKATLVEQLIAMDGVKGYLLGKARREAFDRLEATELAARDVTALIAADATPQARPFKRLWYFQLPFGTSVLAGGLTLMLVVLPVIIVAAQEAVRAVPQSMRHGCLALGGTKWQAIAKIVLPAAIPGTCTGTILAMSRAIGEAAPLLLIGAVFVTSVPKHLMNDFSAMPLQIYQWAGEPESSEASRDFASTAAAGIIALLAVLLSFNAVAVLIRMKFQKPLS